MYISLVVEENETRRTQEFVCDGLRMAGTRSKEKFSPPGAMREVEEYQVELSNVTVLELVIKPNIGRGLARASLKKLRLS